MIHRFLYFVALGLLWCGCQSKPVAVDATPSTPDSTKERSTSNVPVILFFGNSLTAGYGLEASQAFPALIQQRLDSLGIDYKVVNAGLSGETTASGRNRIEWVLRQDVAILILELGANDGLRGIDPSETRENLKAIIETFNKQFPEGKIVLAGMEVPPNMGSDYAAKFRIIFKDLAEEYSLALIPFLLENVGGEVDLNQSDGIHPNEEGHKIVAENVWRVLKDIL